MKDFLYLDTDTISSISAQLFEGNIIETNSSESNTSSEGVTDSRTNRTGENTSSGGSFKILSYAKGDNSSFSDSIANKWDESSTAIQSTKKAFDDYLYNKVIEELENKDQLNNINEAYQFDFVRINNIFTVLDFDLTTALFDTDLLKRLPSFNSETFELEDIKNLEKRYNSLKTYIKSGGTTKLPPHFKTQEEALNFYNMFGGFKIIETMNEFALHLNKIFKNKIIMYTENTILIGEKDKLRISSDLLALTDTVTLEGFGRVVTRTQDQKTIEEVTQFGDLINTESFFAQGTYSLLFIFLNLLLGLNEKSTFEIIQPIGLEFSKVPR